jgi:imidazolonepropionase-like amidohydrolase
MQYRQFSISIIVFLGRAGPRIVGAGHYLSVTGGGGDLNDFSSDNGCCVHPDGIICDGADAMRVAVRREIKYGSDWIKVRAAACIRMPCTGPA